MCIYIYHMYIYMYKYLTIVNMYVYIPIYICIHTLHHKTRLDYKKPHLTLHYITKMREPQVTVGSDFCMAWAAFVYNV